MMLYNMVLMFMCMVYYWCAIAGKSSVLCLFVLFVFVVLFCLFYFYLIFFFWGGGFW